MGRAKSPRPEKATTDQPALAQTPPAPSAAGSPCPSSKAAPALSSSTSASIAQTLARSWYGAWPRVYKAEASTPEVARKNITGATCRPHATPDFSRFGFKNPETATIPENEATNAAPTNAAPAQDSTAQSKPPVRVTQSLGRSAGRVLAEQAAPAPDESPTRPRGEESAAPSPVPTTEGWLTWLIRAPESIPRQPLEDVIETDPKPAPSAPQPKDNGIDAPEVVEQEADTNECEVLNTDPARHSGSWLSYLLPSAKLFSEPPAEEGTTAEEPDAAQEKEKSIATGPAEDTAVPVLPSAEDGPPTVASSAASTWSLWSNEPKSKGKRKSTDTLEVAQSAAPHTKSDKRNRSVKTTNVAGTRVDTTPVTKPTSSSGKNEEALKRAQTQPVSVQESQTGPHSNHSKIEVLTSGKAAVKAVGKADSITSNTANLLLPTFEETYKFKQSLTVGQKISKLLLGAVAPPVGVTPGPHVFRRKEISRVRKAVAIGVHGVVPGYYVGLVIGQSQGTSEKFAKNGAEAIQQWADANGCGEEVEIVQVPLVGAGRISERVESLWKLLVESSDQLRDADLVMMFCHSQGVPVSIMLMAKLIEKNIVNAARLGVCAMAGVSLGPFADGYWRHFGMFMTEVAELWEFGNPRSQVSQWHEKALKTCLDYGVRVTYIGSIDDQVVPLDSAVYSPIVHPYIYRAVFVDGREHTPSFISHLVGFALKLRNLGISDHGVTKELSVSLAGNLVSGEGHSRLYDDQQVYYLSVRHALETTDIRHPSSTYRARRGATSSAVDRSIRASTADSGVSGPAGAAPNTTAANTDIAASSNASWSVASATPAPPVMATNNPFNLPWSMRGLLEEPIVKTEFRDETARLLGMFDDWNPKAKALSDVKYRLEAIRSKL